jgi:peptidyl-prolyl cis-trans isomerase C
MRLSLTVAAALLCVPALPAAVMAQATSPAASAAASPATPPTPGATPAQPDPLVAKVGDRQIHLSDVSEAAQTLPDEVRSMPPQVLFPMLLDQMVDREALVIQAKKLGLEKDPVVQHAIDRATDQVLQNAVLSRDIGPTVTDAALHAKYDAEIANKPGEAEVHAQHILVPTEDEAKKVIDQLNKGADFATLAKQDSKDPGAQNGGDLGFFKQGDMVPEFSAAAFALKPGQFTQTPVKTQFGYHVIKVIERRVAPPPSFDQAKDQLRQEAIQAGVRQVLAKARVGLPVEKFNMDGTPMTASAVPPSPPGAPATDLPPTPGVTPAVPK